MWRRRPAAGDGDLPRGGRGVAAAADEAGNPVADDGADGDGIAVAHGRARARPGGAERGIDDDHVRVPPRPEEAAVEAVDLGHVAGRGRDRPGRVEARQRCDVDHGVDHAERHDAAAGGRVGRDQEAVEGAVFARRLGAEQRRPQVAGGADLHGDARLRRHLLEVAVLDGDRPAVDVEGDGGVDGDQVRAGDRKEPGIEAPPVCSVVSRPASLASRTSAT